jgi:hypothetical protein
MDFTILYLVDKLNIVSGIGGRGEEKNALRICCCVEKDYNKVKCAEQI